MSIAVEYTEDKVIAEFVQQGASKRLWLHDQNKQTVGRYCPHKDLGWDECRNCAMDFSE